MRKLTFFANFLVTVVERESADGGGNCNLAPLKHVGFCPSFLSMLAAAKVWRETNRIYGVDFQKALRFATEVISSVLVFFGMGDFRDFFHF